SCVTAGHGSNMQELSAYRNRLSEIQRFSSTRMRCITAIWAAGPPKLRSATRVHTRSASLNDTPCAGTDLIFSAVDTCVMRLSWSWRLRAILAFQLGVDPQ